MVTVMLMVTTNILLDCSIAWLTDVPLAALLTVVHCDKLSLRFPLPWWHPGAERGSTTKNNKRLKATMGSRPKASGHADKIGLNHGGRREL